MITSCLECKKQASSFRYRYTKHNNNFCSNVCWAKNFSDRSAIYRSCLFCQKPVKTVPSEKRKPFCSKAHREKWFNFERVRKFESFFKKTNGCWEWFGKLSTHGYGKYRFSYETYVGKIPTRKHVLHSCDNKKCVNPSHLRLGSHIENMNDMVTRKRHQFGERHHQAKLTEMDVHLIRAMLSTGYKQIDLASIFRVDPSCISNINIRRNWKNT